MDTSGQNNLNRVLSHYILLINCKIGIKLKMPQKVRHFLGHFHLCGFLLIIIFTIPNGFIKVFAFPKTIIYSNATKRFEDEHKRE
jgi:hypothetical protein